MQPRRKVYECVVWDSGEDLEPKQVHSRFGFRSSRGVAVVIAKQLATCASTSTLASVILTSWVSVSSSVFLSFKPANPISASTESGRSISEDRADLTFAAPPPQLLITVLFLCCLCLASAVSRRTTQLVWCVFGFICRTLKWDCGLLWLPDCLPTPSSYTLLSNITRRHIGYTVVVTHIIIIIIVVFFNPVSSIFLWSKQSVIFLWCR